MNEDWVEHQKLAWKSVDIRLKYGFDSPQYRKSHQECVESLERLRRKQE